MNDELQLEGVINGEGTPATPPVENQPAAQPQVPVSEDAKTQQAVGSEVKEDMVPRSRLNEVILQRDKAREDLLSATQKQEAPKVVNDEVDTDEALKLVEEIADRKASERISKLERKIDLERVASKYSDFDDHIGQITELVKQNPLLSFDQAYKLVKFDGVQESAKADGIAEGQKQVNNLNSATVEGGSTQGSPLPKSSEGLDPLAKGPDGKFLYSMDELESVLPKK